MKQLFYGDYAGKSVDSIIDDLCENYEVELSALDGVEFIIAALEGFCYEEQSYFVIMKNGKLYENYASHCSCHGFEGQWNPEETTIEFLRHKAHNADESYVQDVLREYFNMGVVA